MNQPAQAPKPRRLRRRLVFGTLVLVREIRKHYEIDEATPAALRLDLVLDAEQPALVNAEVRFLGDLRAWLV